MSGDTVVVGAISEDSNAAGVNGNQADNSASSSGAAYVFVRDSGGGWTQQAYLKASNTGGWDFFGWQVAVSGDTVVVGAVWESSNATGVNGDQADNSADQSGAAYVFVRDGNDIWSQQAYLKASNTDAFDGFGVSVAVSGDTVVVGADNSFDPPEHGESSNATGVNGDQADNSANGSGAAYFFVRDGNGTWSQQAYLKASNTNAGDAFGVPVAVSGNTVVVGAVFESSNATGVNGNQADNSAWASGAAYVFVITPSVCGNGAVEGAEQCDDGNNADCDGCKSDCTSILADCNTNGIADECDIADCVNDPCCDDCNGNGVPDECDPDFDGDCIPDACDLDVDGDGVPNGADNCPLTPNGPDLGTCVAGLIGMTCHNDDECDASPASNPCSMDQENSDSDADGDACDSDDDNDNWPDADDNCPGLFNPGVDCAGPGTCCGIAPGQPWQPDADCDGLGDPCDPCPGADDDNDGVDNCDDNCRSVANPGQGDGDQDGVGDACDACLGTPAGESIDGNGCSCNQYDDDNDGVGNCDDNCRSVANTGQEDDDQDGVGNACDSCLGTPAGEPVDGNGCSCNQYDDDSDGVGNCDDNCRSVANTGQEDGDQDGLGHACDSCPGTPASEPVDGNGCSCNQYDDDSDGVGNCDDNCRSVPNPAQEDVDQDGVGDACDSCPGTPAGESIDENGCSCGDLDGDADGVDSCTDNCRFVPNMNQENADTDFHGDACDNCRDVHNPNQADLDRDGLGDACDPDADGDGWPEAGDNCPLVPNPDQADSDGDGIGDCCDPDFVDTDGDAVTDICDNCLDVPNGPSEAGDPDVGNQTDIDSDGIGDACDVCPGGDDSIDTDSDGTPDCDDNCPDDANADQADGDGDGVGDTCDPCPSDNPDDTDDDGVCDDDDTCAGFDDNADVDSDTVADGCDNCPNVPNGAGEAGMPGVGNQTDSDGDGIGDACDGCPLDESKTEPGVCDCGIPDVDTDGDGTADCIDGCPSDGNKIEEGVCGCGVSDTDTDGDGIADCIDECPSDPDKAAPGLCGCGVSDVDTDSDGTPDCHDNCADDVNVDQANSDSDSLGDACDNCPLAGNEAQGDTNSNGIGDVCEACFWVNRLKIGTKQAKCEGVELLEVTSCCDVDNALIVKVYVPGLGEDKLEANTVVNDAPEGTNGPQTIHTSCSQPIEINQLFGAYKVTNLLKLHNDDVGEKGNKLDMRGSFSPVLPIDLEADDVTYTIDDGQGHTLTLVIPSGSFVQEGNPAKQKFEFESHGEDSLEIKARFDFIKCEFRLDAKGLQNTNQMSDVNLTVRLEVGVSIGQETITATDKHNHLKFKREPKQECCPE